MAGNALELINNIFQENEDCRVSMPLFLTNIRNKLSSFYSGAKILNAPNVTCSNGEFVRFRGIIQNSSGFELFASNLEATDEKGNRRSICGAFQNDFDASWTNLSESKSTNSRYLYTITEIPGESEWALQTLLSQGSDEDNVEEKRRKVDDKKFMIKLYEDCDNTLLPNVIVDLYGIYQNGSDIQENDPSLTIPSIHIVSHSIIDTLALAPRPIDYISDVKGQLLSYLISLLGCEVAAHYLLLSLVSKTYSRKDELTFPLCSLPLTLVNVRNSKDVISILKLLMPMAQVIEITPETLEKEKLFPVMDHESETLSSAKLQLSKGSVLVLDMTKFEIGQAAINLQNNAVDNIQALKTLIGEQKILYDYKFYKHPLETDVITIILSKNPWKFVETPFVVALPNAFVDGLDPINELKKSHQNHLNSYRHFLAEARTRVESVRMPMDFQRLVCEGFTEIRRQYNKDAPDRLKHLLTLTRLMAVIDSKSNMDTESYDKVTTFEEKRIDLLNKFVRESH